jgi:hypothetical protein
MIMPIECEPQNNGEVHKYIAINGDYHGGDSKSYDWGNIYIGTQGLPEKSAPVAEIWLTYEIAFFKPLIQGNEPIDKAMAVHYHMVGNDSSATGVFGNNTGFYGIGSCPYITVALSDGRIEFSEQALEGRYLFLWTVIGPSGGYTPPVVSYAAVGTEVVTNCWASSVGSNNNDTHGCTGIAETTSERAYIFNLTYDPATGKPYGPCFIQFGGQNVPAGNVYGDLYIVRLPAGLVIGPDDVPQVSAQLAAELRLKKLEALCAKLMATDDESSDEDTVDRLEKQLLAARATKH